MSAWADDPSDFAKHFEAAGGQAGGFAQRRFFGQYLRKVLDEAVESGRTIEIHSRAVRAQRAGDFWNVEFEDGSAIEAEALVLATGNQEPDRLKAFDASNKRFVSNPWGEDARAAVLKLKSSNDDAFILGTGLTMVDLVLSLDGSGFNGKILALSRRGLAPRAHAKFEPEPVLAEALPKNLRSLVRWIRERSSTTDWRAPIDSLRPHSHKLWQGLDLHEQHRFLRHVRPWWDVHRHRIAPEVAAIVERLEEEGRLKIVAGKVVTAAESNDEITIEFRRRGSSSPECRSFGYAFNCTGPLHSIERTRDPLLRSLLEAGAVRSDRLGIGLEIDTDSRAGKRIWALGPLTKGRYWEIVAVPDIREQAAAAAGDIARELQK